MSFSMLTLLLHSAAVPAEVRELLRAADAAPPDRRDAELLFAAQMLYRDTDLDCGEVRELVGLPLVGDCT